jgi:hypothetical protein
MKGEKEIAVERWVDNDALGMNGGVEGKIWWVIRTT